MFVLKDKIWFGFSSKYGMCWFLGIRDMFFLSFFLVLRVYCVCFKG